MNVRHDPVVITQPCNALILCRTAVDSDKFANGIAITYLQAGRFASVLLVLGSSTDRGKLEDIAILANAGMTRDDHMRANVCPCPDDNV